MLNSTGFWRGDSRFPLGWVIGRAFRQVGVGPNLAASPRGTSCELRGLRKTIFKKNCKISKIDFETLFKLITAFKFSDKEFIDQRIKVS